MDAGINAVKLNASIWCRQIDAHIGCSIIFCIQSKPKWSHWIVALLWDSLFKKIPDIGDNGAEGNSLNVYQPKMKI